MLSLITLSLSFQVPIQKTQAPKVIRVKTDSYKDQDLSPFAARALKKVGEHPIVVHNPYTSWFASGSASRDEVRDLVVQFSVFSNLFLIAQLNKIINSPTLDDMREGKEILANEIGVVFNKGKKEAAPAAGDAAGFDPSLVSVSGTVEGGVYKHRAAHFEWLLDVGESVGLEFKDLGKRRHGTAATLHFCDQLNEIYGSEDPNVSIGASFAIEHWANAGFWDELVMGFKTCAARPRFSARNSRPRNSRRAILGAQFSDAAPTHPSQVQCAQRRGGQGAARLLALPPGARGAARRAHDGRARGGVRGGPRDRRGQVRGGRQRDPRRVRRLLGRPRADPPRRRRRRRERLPRVERARDLRPIPTLPASSGSQRDVAKNF